MILIKEDVTAYPDPMEGHRLIPASAAECYTTHSIHHTTHWEWIGYPVRSVYQSIYIR